MEKLTSDRLPRPAGPYSHLAVAAGLVFTAGFGLITAVWQGLLVAFVTEGSISLLIVIWYTAIQRLVPDQFLGRVMSLDWMISIAGLPLSFAVVGPLANWIGTDRTLILAGVAGAVVTIFAMFIPGARGPERDGRLAEAARTRA